MTVPDSMIEVPACQICHDWMRPAMLWVYPYDAVVWVCVGGCGELVCGIAMAAPEGEDLSVMTMFARLAMEGAHDE